MRAPKLFRPRAIDIDQKEKKRKITILIITAFIVFLIAIRLIFR